MNKKELDEILPMREATTPLVADAVRVLTGLAVYSQSEKHAALKIVQEAAFRAGAEAMRAKLRENAERSGLIMLPGLEAFLRDIPMPEMDP